MLKGQRMAQVFRESRWHNTDGTTFHTHTQSGLNKWDTTVALVSAQLRECSIYKMQSACDCYCDPIQAGFQFVCRPSSLVSTVHTAT